jgi:hypothetical protein
MTCRIQYNLPVEWVDYFARSHIDDDFDEYENSHDCFACDSLREWVAAHPNHHYRGRVNEDSFTTDEHQTPGYEGNLICHTYEFDIPIGAFYRSAVRRELRISVPSPTKLPLP